MEGIEGRAREYEEKWKKRVVDEIEKKGIKVRGGY